MGYRSKGQGWSCKVKGHIQSASSSPTKYTSRSKDTLKEGGGYHPGRTQITSKAPHRTPITNFLILVLATLENLCHDPSSKMDADPPVTRNCYF